MGTQSLRLATTCEPRSKPSERLSKSQLIREWIAKLALNAGQALDATAIGVYQAIWEEGFEELPYGVLEAAFKKTLRTRKFWPVKVADVLEHVERAKKAATTEAADRAWEYVLDLRRVYWNPDMPAGFSRGMPKLSPRIERACRAAGVFRDHESVEALHVWAKKQFIESFLRWDETGESENLLPNGEIKSLLASFAETKALPYAGSTFEELHRKGLEYAKKIACLGTVAPQNYHAPQRATVWDAQEERRAALAALEQKETNPVLLDKIKSQKAALESRELLQSTAVQR